MNGIRNGIFRARFRVCETETYLIKIVSQYLDKPTISVWFAIPESRPESREETHYRN